jgi:hypothetical protein
MRGNYCQHRHPDGNLVHGGYDYLPRAASEHPASDAIRKTMADRIMLTVYSADPRAACPTLPPIVAARLARELFSAALPKLSL